MDKLEVLLICIVIHIASCQQNIANIKLFVGPRHNETGRYLYKSNTPDMTSSKSRGVYEHCLYCDNNIAFINTSMNKLHQEPQCIANNLNIDEDDRPKYETDNGLFPYCKLGDVPVCGPPPHRENIQSCDRGYSNTLFSMYFSCLIWIKQSGTVLSEYYCNENLQWELLRNYEEEVVIIASESTQEPVLINVTMATRTTLETKRTTNDYQRAPNREKETDISGGIFLVIIILAVVLAVFTIIMSVLLLRYVCKRRKRNARSRQRSKYQHSSPLYPAINPLVNKCGNESMPAEGVSLLNATLHNTSNGSCQTDVEAGQPASSLETSVQSSSGRAPPIGQENFPVQVTQSGDIQTSLRENHVTPIVDLDTNRSVNPEISISNVQSQGHVSVDKWIGAQHDCKSSGNFHRVNSGTGDQRQEPVGKVSKPRHNEMLEENSQITEPKRVVSTERMDICGSGNDESFEIDPNPDSGINMNIRSEPYHMLDLKQ